MAPLNTALGQSVKRAAYAAGQAARILWFTGHYAAGRRLMGPLTEPGEAPYAEISAPLDRARLKTAFREAFKQDWKNIEAGRYKIPIELRRAPSPASLFRQSRDYLRDAQKVARRKHANAHSEVLTEAAREKYPRYYLQNFHYQSDGWLTAGSADRYDMQVETLFTGAAGAMRRAGLGLLSDVLKTRDVATTSLLDIGCGAGSFLRDVKDNWSALDVTALDLSPAYLGRARATLGQWEDVKYVEAAVEDTGLPSHSFDVITATYLFHELPPAVRKRVATEIVRLLKPGGAFIILDTIQFGDEPGLDILLENFPRGFHEPYYDSYCRTDLDALFAKADLAPTAETISFLSKAVAFSKIQ